MTQSLQLKIRGLYTFPNDFSAVPEGSLSIGENIIIDRDSIAEPRKGLTYVAKTGGARADLDADYYFERIFFYKSTIVALVYNGSTAKRYFKYFDPTSGWLDCDDSGGNKLEITAFTSNYPKVRGYVDNGNLYTTTGSGVYKIDTEVDIPKRMGVPEATQLASSLIDDATTNWLPNGYFATYRSTWNRQDANGNWFEGAPSSALIVYNPSAKTFVDTNVNTTIDAVLVSNHGFSTGLKVVTTTSGIAPGGLAPGSYYIIRVDFETIRFASSYANAIAGTYIDITTQGGAGDTQTITPPIATPRITVQHPALSKAGDVIKLYRSKSAASGSNDELYQCYEFQIASGTSTDIDDIVPDAALSGQFLYTNENQEGIELANVTPPLAKDIAAYRDCAFLANIQEVSQYTLQITKTDTVANAGAIVAGDTIKIDGVTYTAVVEATGSPTSQQFRVYVSGTPSQDSANTSLDLVRAINQYNQANESGVWASYVPNVNLDFLGTIIIKRTSFSAAPDYFDVNSSKKFGWIPPLQPVGGFDNNTRSTYEIKTNYLACSKPQESESFPIPYRWSAGSSDYPILRVLALRDSLFILKEDGTYRLSGTDPNNFQVSLLDSTANIVCPDCAVVLNNQIYALTTQGVVTINENGVTIISRPIEKDLKDILRKNLASNKIEAFAVGNETEKTYYLFLVDTELANSYPNVYYRYNFITNNWTKGTRAQIAGGVNPADNLMYFSTYGQLWMDVERSTGTNFDYADYVSTNAISAVSNKTITIANASSLQLGQTILQDDNYTTYTINTGSGGGFNYVTNVVTKTAHGYHTGMKFLLSKPAGPGAYPAGLANQYYWIIKLGADTFKIASTYANALAGTAIDFTDDGTTGYYVIVTPDTAEKWATITEIGSTTVTVDKAIQFRITNAVVSDPIMTDIVWNPNTMQNPGINKQYRETAILFLSDFYGQGEVSFQTDLSATILYEEVSGSVAGPWGQFPWGTAPWGGGVRRRPLRVSVPRIHQRASFIKVGFHHSVCFSPWAIQGISLIGNNISEKVWSEGNRI